MKNKNGECDGRKKYQIIGKVKEQTEVGELCQNHPWEFGVYLRYCRNLRFAQKPDYNYLRLLFRGCLKRFFFVIPHVFLHGHSFVKLRPEILIRVSTGILVGKAGSKTFFN